MASAPDTMKGWGANKFRFALPVCAIGYTLHKLGCSAVECVRQRWVGGVIHDLTIVHGRTRLRNHAGGWGERGAAKCRDIATHKWPSTEHE